MTNREKEHRCKECGVSSWGRRCRSCYTKNKRKTVGRLKTRRKENGKHISIVDNDINVLDYY